MKVLLSAYACEPNKGSEPEVGWQRALHMTDHADEVWVLTRANNQQVIEALPESRKRGLHFIYHDPPAWTLKLKRNHWFLRIFVSVWQWSAYRAVREIHRIQHFDQVYHVTFVGMVSGSFMGRLGIPFIVGPIAGGERAPLSMRRSLPVKYKLVELARDAGIVLQRYSPLTLSTLAKAERIYVATSESKRLVLKRWHHKTHVQLAIGSSTTATMQSLCRPVTAPHFVFAGRLLHWKGIHLAIRALAKSKDRLPNATLTILGHGPAEDWLRATAEEFAVSSAVTFAGQLPQQKFIESLGNYRAMLFPSFHDSGGLVVLEAFRNGLPVICFKLGGPGIMVDQSSGIVVPVEGGDDEQAVTRLSNAMISIAQMEPLEYERLSAGARSRANEFSWSALTNHVVHG